MDAEGFGRWNGGVKNRPLVLQGAAVGGALGEEGGDLRGVAADAEGTDGSLLNEIFEEAEKVVVLQVGGAGFVEEPEVDVVGAEGGEAAVEEGASLSRCVGGAFGVARGCIGFLREALLEVRSCLTMGPARRRPRLMRADFFGGRVPYFVVTVISSRWCWRNSPRQLSASP